MNDTGKVRTLVVVGAVLTRCATAVADQTLALKAQMSLHGDFILIGQSMGRECDDGTPPDPLVGSYSCAGVTNRGDSSPDIFWQSSFAPTGATANTSITATGARTTAQLNLPPGVEIRYARLFWAAIDDVAGTAGFVTDFLLPGESTPTAVVADSTYTANTNGHFFYQSSADVTAHVLAKGTGQYSASGFFMDPLDRPTSVNEYFAGWFLIVIFESADTNTTLPQRHIAVFDGFDFISGTANVELAINGFLVPPGPGVANSRIGVVTYEGDHTITGDQLEFRVNRDTLGASGPTGSTGYAAVSNALNPANNFFNASNSYFGVAVASTGPSGPCANVCSESDVLGCYCNNGHLPQNTGAPFSGGGMDIDVFDITSLGLLKPGDVAAKFRASTSGDFFGLAGFVTSFATLSPAFTNSYKSVEVLGGIDPHEVRPGDRVRYTIMIQNTGNDPAINCKVEDTLDNALVLDQTSIKAGQAFPLATSADFTYVGRTLTVPVGISNPPFTGWIDNAVGDTWYVSFEATIVAGATAGAVPNIAEISAAGQSGAAEQRYGTSGTSGPILPNTPTVFPVAECDGDAECSTGKICKDIGTDSYRTCVPGCRDGSNGCSSGQVCTSSTSTPGQCVECTSETHCTDPSKPICASNTCTGCQNDGECATRDPGKPICVNSSGQCGVCDSDNTSTCATGVCVLPSGQCGCTYDTECGGSTPICVNQLCTGCSSDGQCANKDPTLPACTQGGDCQECSSSNTSLCTSTEPVCVPSTETCGCVTSADCSGTTPICNGGTCTSCTGDAECAASNPALPACKPSGACGECSETNQSACTGDKPVCMTNVGQCGCSNDTDCGANGACINELCVNIACGSSDECTSSVAGSACLEVGSCGCVTDGDCGSIGGAVSCDSIVQRCVAATPGGPNGPGLKGGRIEGGGLFKCSQSGPDGWFWTVLIVALALRRRYS